MSRLKHIMNERRKRPPEFEDLEAFFDGLTDEEKDEAIRQWEEVASKSKKRWWVINKKPMGKIWFDPKVTVQDPYKRSLWKKAKQRFMLCRIWLDKKTTPLIHKWSYRMSEFFMKINRSHQPNPNYRSEGRLTQRVGSYRDKNGNRYPTYSNPAGTAEGKRAAISDEEYKRRIDILANTTPPSESVEQNDPSFEDVAYAPLQNYPAPFRGPQ